MAVFVLDQQKKPLMPCPEKRARRLLERDRAVVVKRYPFAIRLKDRVGGELQPIRIKLDPGSKQTGIAIVRESQGVDPETGEITSKISVFNLLQLHHRGLTISKNLTSRCAMRRRRRSNLRYRGARFDNRTKPKGWLAPSLQHRVNTTINWVNKLQRFAPIATLSQELVRFDLQQIESPEISGVEYQQGELQGYEVRKYLLDKWDRKCAYCGVEQVPLEIEHIVPKSAGGSNKVSNLTLACRPCNQKKGSQALDIFLANKPELLQRIKAQAKKPLKDAAIVNSTRWALANALKTTRLPVELASGGRTQFNRVRLDIPKSHALDAACVGVVEAVQDWNKPILEINCAGRGRYQRTRLDKFGFPRGYLMRKKSVFGFQTGDIVKAVVTKGKKVGEYVGRIAIRASGHFDITTGDEKVSGISYKYCQMISRNDGYGYFLQPKAVRRLATPVALSLPALKDGVSRAF
ncbi:HNH endonuclease [Thioploca ingrica]|uniref:HNH endonuclease n=1 Tax=Thioploca ingrica TaxID=40754 RepID=A0A090AQ57_9GAMM|nr:HNH endonuclease [Thioploca ingrica]